jgi:hypothetical protein
MVFISSKIYIAFLLFIGLAWCHPAAGKKCHPHHSQSSQVTATSSVYEILPSSIPGEKKEVSSSQIVAIVHPTQSYYIVPTPTTTSASSSLTTTTTTSTTTTAESSTASSSGALTQTQPSYLDVNTPQTAILAFANGANDGRKNVQNGATETLINARNLACYLAISTFIYYLL